MKYFALKKKPNIVAPRKRKTLLTIRNTNVDFQQKKY